MTALFFDCGSLWQEYTAAPIYLVQWPNILEGTDPPYVVMASPARLKGKDKAAAWEVKRGEIGLLIAEGMDLHQIEEKLQRDGTRVTAQVREHIIWEISSPQVRELLAQGLNVAGVEEKMRMRGWIWTNSLRRKAWWEYYREEIIGLYKKLRSVESVREVMAKKGFTPQYVTDISHFVMSTKMAVGHAYIMTGCGDGVSRQV